MNVRELIAALEAVPEDGRDAEVLAQDPGDPSVGIFQMTYSVDRAGPLYDDDDSYAFGLRLTV